MRSLDMCPVLRWKDELAGAVGSIKRCGIVELRFRSDAGYLVFLVPGSRLDGKPCSLVHRDAKKKKVIPRVSKDDEGNLPSRSAPHTRLMLLRSPEVGIWSAAIAEGKPGGVYAGGTILGHVRTLLSDEPLIAPCEGKLRKWLVEEGDPVGMGTPLAFWEVC